MKRIFKYIFSLLLIFLTASPAVQAKPISPETARQNVADFLAKPKARKVKGTAAASAPATLTLAQTVTDSRSVPLIYVFSRGADKGFVIASADDRLAPILGHTDRGTFESIDKLPEGVKSLLKGYENAIPELTASLESGETAIKERDEIEPLVELFWGQDSPLNAKCPVVDGSRAPVGCVGLAMAMAMAHHQYPPKGKGSISYVNNKDKQTIEYNFEEAVFDYENMLEYYDGYEDQVEIDAVAELCLAAGVSVKSEYRADGTGADLSATVFNTYFDYPPEGLALLSRSYFSPEEWDDLVYEELQNDRPLVYRGGGVIGTGGHAFVIDGYEKETGLFHINWGWYGDAEGYYNLSVLRPTSSGTGSNGDDVYSIDQQIVRGLRPPEGEIPTPIFTGEGVSFDLDTQQFTIDRLYCRGGQNEIYPGLKAYNTQTGETVEIESLNKEPLTILDNSATGSVNRLTVVFNPDFSELADGEYILRPVARLTENPTINPGNYLDFYPVYCTLMNDRYVTVTIKDGQVEKAESGTDADHDIEFTDFNTDTSLITGSNRAFTMYGVNRGNTILRAVRVWVYHHNSDELAWPTAERSDFVLEPGNSGTFDLAIPNMTNMGGTFDLQVTNYEDSSILYSDRIPFKLANSSEGVTINGFKYVITSEEEKTAAVIRINSVTHKGEIVFPETVEIKGQQYALTEISNGLLISQTGVTKVTLPETVKRIAGSSFNGCSSLTEINLPENLEFIGGGCFLGCRSLTSITIPKNIKTIRDKTFSTSGLTSVELPEGLVSIGKYAFYSCKFPRVVIPSTVETIGDYAFDNSIINVVICKAVNPPAITDRTFYSQTYRTATLFVPEESVETYRKAPVWEKFTTRYPINEDRYAKVNDVWYELTQDFEAYVVPAQNNETYNLTRLSVPATVTYKGMEYKVTEIADYAFAGHKELTAFAGGGNIRRIGHHAFENTGITSASFAGPIEEIGDYAFYNTDLGTLARLPSALKKIGKYAFAENKRFTFYKGFNDTNWLFFPDCLETIGDGAFEGCETLDKIQLNSNIDFGKDVFAGCSMLESICLGNTSISHTLAEWLADNLEDSHFYIDKNDREYFKEDITRPDQLYDILSVKSVAWENQPVVSGITHATVTFDSTLGNPGVSNFIMKDQMFRDLGSLIVESTENYATDGTIIITIAPALTGSGNVQINFVQSGLGTNFAVNVVEAANLIQAITLSETSKTLKPNEKYTLSATYTPDNVENDQLVWTSSAPKVATVDEHGCVTAVGLGSATITCKALMGLASAKCTVSVVTQSRPGKAIDEDDPNAPITVNDVVAIANHIMGDTHESFNADNADANRDGKISVSDISTTVKIIMEQDYALPANEDASLRTKAISTLSQDNFLNFSEIIFANSNTSVSHAALEAVEDFTALQADIMCPAGLEITNIELDNLSSHLLSWKRLDGGNYRVVIYSLSSDLLPVSPAPMLKLTLNKAGNPSGVLTLSNAWVSTPGAQKDNLYVSGGTIEIPTGIGMLYTDFPEPCADIFTVDGVLIKRNVEIMNLRNELQPGIYILRGSNSTAKVLIN